MNWSWFYARCYGQPAKNNDLKWLKGSKITERCRWNCKHSPCGTEGSVGGPGGAVQMPPTAERAAGRRPWRCRAVQTRRITESWKQVVGVTSQIIKKEGSVTLWPLDGSISALKHTEKRDFLLYFFLLYRAALGMTQQIDSFTGSSEIK